MIIVSIVLNQFQQYKLENQKLIEFGNDLKHHTVPKKKWTLIICQYEFWKFEVLFFLKDHQRTAYSSRNKKYFVWL